MYHIISSLLLAFIIYLLYRQIIPALLVFFIGVFIDLDHLIDFWANKPANPFSVQDFLRLDYSAKIPQWIFVFGHGWEWVILIFGLAYFYNWNIYLVPAGMALALHLLLDIANLKKLPKLHPFIYFFFFRFFRGFKGNKLQKLGQSQTPVQL